MSLKEYTSYRLSDIKDIPILDVCDFLGIQVEKRGRSYWCKVREESTASTILHTENNTFYDFGTQEHGSNIDLYCVYTGAEFGEAVSVLGEAFQLSPETDFERKIRNQTMSMSDYARIGLYGDLATKNFRFDIENLSTDQLVAIERKYEMSMNDLRREHPGVYSRVISEKAVPFVEEQRNLYYLKAWNYYSLLKLGGCTYLFFDSSNTMPRFKKEMYALEKAERSLCKAAIGTALDLKPQSVLTPIEVVTRVMQGKLNISVGEMSETDFRSLAEQKEDGILSFHLSEDDFFKPFFQKQIESLPHTANIVSDGVLLSIISRDIPKLKRELGTAWAVLRPISLDHMIHSAASRKPDKSEKEKQEIER